MQVKVATLSKYRLEVDLTLEEVHRLLALLEPVQEDGEEEGVLDRIYWELTEAVGLTSEGNPFRARDSRGTPINSIYLKEKA